MAPRKKDVLGELVWVLQGKTEHPAHLLSNEPPVIAGGVHYLWIKFSTNGESECVQETDIRREDAPVGRRSRRTANTNEQGNGESKHAVKKEEHEESNKASTHKRSKPQQEGRPGKQARTAKTAGNPASLDAEDSLASASHPTTEENEAQGNKKKKNSASLQRFRRSQGLKLKGRVQATNTAGIVASPPKAAPWSIPDIEIHDRICTKDHGWAEVIGYSFSSPRKGNHPKLFQIKWKDEDETILEAYVSEDNITQHIPRSLQADAFDEVSDADEIENIIDANLAEKALRTADELYPIVDAKTTTLGGITMSVLEACSIMVENGKEQFDPYYNIIKRRIFNLIKEKAVQPGLEVTVQPELEFAAAEHNTQIPNDA
jgi:hypothetical protein